MVPIVRALIRDTSWPRAEPPLKIDLNGGETPGGDPVNSRSLKSYLKFLPLVALFAFGVTLISLPRGTEATPIGAPTLSLTFVPIGGSTIVTGMYTDDTPAGSGNAVLTGTPALGAFAAGATVTPNNGETVTAAGATVNVTEDGDTLATAKTVAATFTCSTPGVMAFNITHGGQTSPQSVSLICGSFANQFPGAQYPIFPGAQFPIYPGAQLPTSYNVVASALTVTASPASVTCASPSSVSVAVRDVSGNPAANGTSVTISASSGTISPNVVSTSGGIATATYTAPDNSNGTATITATSGQGSGYATVTYTCTGVSTTSPSVPVYVPPAVTGPIGVIVPPNTGDAGLAATRLSGS
jgi:hypothetical protein